MEVLIVIIFLAGVIAFSQTSIVWESFLKQSYKLGEIHEGGVAETRRKIIRGSAISGFALSICAILVSSAKVDLFFIGLSLLFILFLTILAPFVAVTIYHVKLIILEGRIKYKKGSGDQE